MAGARLCALDWQTSIDARLINVMVMHRGCHTVRDRIVSEQGIEIFRARTAFLRSQNVGRQGKCHSNRSRKFRYTGRDS